MSNEVEETSHNMAYQEEELHENRNEKQAGGESSGGAVYKE